MPPSPPTPAPRPSLVATLLRPFARVEADEVTTAALMTLTVFLLLTSYYILKTAREPLILLQGGAEVKSYAAAGQSILLVPVIAGYTALARRLGRMKLLASVYLFFLVNLLLFAGAAKLEWRLGIVFYLWVGIFNVTVIAQFWSFANDIYTPEQGKRLFAILGIGSSVGAVAGARIAHALVDWGPPVLMLAAAGLLVACVALLFVVNARMRAVTRDPRALAVEDEPIKSDAIVRALTHDRYLLLIAGLTLVLNWVNNNGEYLVDRTLLESAHAHAAEAHVTSAVFIGRFKSEYFSYYNVGGVVLQLFAVSRIMRVAGVRGALYVLPIVSFAGYLAVAAVPVLRVVEMTKVAENAIDYSLQNTARQALFLVTDRAGKYIGKTVIDTLMMRLGDVLAAGTVAVGTRLSFETRTFALVNLGLVMVWGATVLFLGREHAKRSAEVDAEVLGVEMAAA
jgi:AAA family ATP:ADP antiporter